jgi:hypothetical protein
MELAYWLRCFLVLFNNTRPKRLEEELRWSAKYPRNSAFLDGGVLYVNRTQPSTAMCGLNRWF